MAIKLAYVEADYEAAEAVKFLVMQGRIGQGPEIQTFEAAFAKWIGRRHAIAVSSGTMADVVALAVIKARYPGRTEVIMPALTFAAQLNAVLMNSLQPVFVDVDKQGLIDEKAILSKVGPNTLCIFPTHLLGQYARVPYSGFPVVEDACEALGSEYEGRKVGVGGEMATFSFFPSHTMTTGEGGMIVTDDGDMADLARTLRNHGKVAQTQFKFKVPGFNAKMTTIQATLGVYALKKLDKAVARRREVFSGLGGTNNAGENICPHGMPVTCASFMDRAKIMAHLESRGIECRTLFSSLPTQEEAYAFLGHRFGEFPNAEFIGNHCFYVPCHHGMTDEHVQWIKESLADAMRIQAVPA